MKLFRSIFTLAILLILIGETSAQGSYFNAGFGYGFAAGDRLGVTEPGGAEKNVYGSFGKGLTVGLNTGYMVNENIGLDLGLWYLMGSTYEFIDDYSSNGFSSHKVSGNTFRIMPEVKITGGKSNKPYAKFGFVMGIITTLNDDETDTGPISMLNLSHEFTGGSSLGWVGAVGIDFSENQTTSLFVEANFCHQVFKPALEKIETGQNTITFKLVDEPNPNDPTEQLRPSFSFSTITITAGVKFSSLLKNKNTPAPAGNK